MPVLTLPEYYERLLFVGENGSGKTELNKNLIAHYERFVAFDLKGDFTPPCDYKVLTEPEDYRWKFMTPPRIVYRPKKQFRSGAWFNHTLEMLWDRSIKLKGKEPFIVDIDEGLMQANLGTTAWLENLIVGARGLNTGVWLNSQRPRNIPVSIRSEAWRWYIFALGYEEDEKEVVRYSKGMLTIADLQTLGDYSFYELRRLKGARKIVTKYPPLQI